MQTLLCHRACGSISPEQPGVRRAGPASGRSTPRGLGVRARQDALGQEQGRRNALLPWPVRLGVGLSFDENDKPHLIFEREEFSLSEAASYFDYTLDVAIRAQRG